MRNFVSKILARATLARLFPRPSESGAPAQGRLDANRLSPLLPAGLAAAVFLGTAPSLAMGQFDTLRDYLDGQTLTVASNLSLDHRFLMFFRQYAGADGELLYELYNRFPIGAYLLNKAALAPFGDSPSAQIAAARLLSAALFSAAAVFAYLGLRRLTNRPWIAAAATLLAFSSYHALFYREMISSEVNGVFGMMLTFHGMTVFAQGGRFRQLLIKAFAAILIDWTVMALLLPFTSVWPRVRSVSRYTRNSLSTLRGQSARGVRRVRLQPTPMAGGGVAAVLRARNGLQPSQRIHRSQRRSSLAGLAFRPIDAGESHHWRRTSRVS